MSKIFTTNTPSLKATMADIRNLNVKAVDAKKIKLNGENLEDLFKSKTDDKINYLKLINRGLFTEELIESDLTYFIYDKIGTILDYKITNTEGFSSPNDVPFIEKLSYINFDLPNFIDGTNCFVNNNTLKSWEGDLENLTTATSMFENSRLESFKGSLKSLVNGSRMFYTEYDSGGSTGSNYLYDSLTFETDSLESLENGSYMFREKELKLKDGIWNYDMPNLENGEYMFNSEDGSDNNGFIFFNADLSSLKSGERMFRETHIKKIKTKLTNLEDGSHMFDGCYLDVESIEELIDEIKNNVATSGSFILDIGASSSLENNEEFWSKYNLSLPVIDEWNEWRQTIKVNNKSGKEWTINIKHW